VVETAGGLMGFLGNVVGWFFDPAHWHGASGVPNRVFEHVQLSAFAIVCAIVVAIPAGIVLGHVRRGGLLAISVVNIGRAVPSFAIVAIALPITLRLGLGFGFWPIWLAVFLLALPPMFTQSYTAITGVDREAVSAARGMGLTERQVLLGVEVPLATPLILAGTRVAAVQVVATAPLGAVVGWGGLGRYIIDGLSQFDIVQVFAGAVLVALLAVVTELAFSALERIVLPVGVRRVSRVDAATVVGRAM
jgi:osmoprotectant transport system permease protein